MWSALCASLEAERQRLAAERQKLAPLTSRDEIQETSRLAQPLQSPPQEALPMTRLLTEHDLQGKSKWELEVMRNVHHGISKTSMRP